MVDTLFGASSSGTGGAARVNGPTFTAPVLGVASATSLTTSNISTLGSYLTGAAHLIGGAYGSNGSGLIDYSLGWNNGQIAVVSGGVYAWASSPTDARGAQDLILARITSGHLGQYDGTNAQQLSIYNTWGGGGSDYERGVFDWKTTSNVLTIGTQKGGSGQSRDVDLVHGGTAIITLYASAASFAQAAQFQGGTAITSTGNIRVKGSGYIIPSSDGVWGVYDESTASFDRLQFGGTTSSFPAIKRRTTALEARLADDSAITTLVGAMVLKAGAVSDTDFTNPVDGCHGYDTTNNKHYVRNGGVWKSSAAYT
jgi:hypothetical protein